MTTTLWLTGLPSSGKTTLAAELAQRQGRVRPVQHLDGDELRRDLFPELRFDKPDRMENIRRIGDIAWMLAGHRVLVIVSVIAPYRQARDAVRAAHRERGLNFVEVHVDAPTSVCAQRDRKGLYAKARRGEITGLTGVGDSYELPPHPEVRVQTALSDIQDCVHAIELALANVESNATAGQPGLLGGGTMEVLA